MVHEEPRTGLERLAAVARGEESPVGRERKGLDRFRLPAGRLQSGQRALQRGRTVHTPHLHEARVAADGELSSEWVTTPAR